jgi:uncharacterized FlaG/YvyC family protein
MSRILPAAGVTLSVAALLPVTGGDASAQRQLTRAVAHAVSQLNESGYAGDGREVLFSVDRATRLPVVKVVDTSTKEVINQWPPEYAIRLAEIQAADKSGDS